MNGLAVALCSKLDLFKALQFFKLFVYEIQHVFVSGQF